MTTYFSISARRLVLTTAVGLTPFAAAAATLTIGVRGADGAALPNAVVAVFVEEKARAARALLPAELSQRGKRFVPAVLAVQTGTPVSFPNFDTVRHHVYSFSAIKTFEIKLYAGTPATPVVFDKPGTAVLGCNIHDVMSAFIRVVDTRYFAVTDAQGQASIEVPAGSHRVQIWHASLTANREPPLQPLEVAAKGSAATLTPEPR